MTEPKTNSPWDAVDKLEALSEPKSECKGIDCNLPDLGIESLNYKPTIAELEKVIGTPDEMDILPNGDVRPKYPSICSNKPTKPSRATEGNLTPIIEPKTKVENSEVTGQSLEQPKNHIKLCNCPDCMPESVEKQFEQPNTELLIVKTIQGLMSAVSRELTELNKITSIAKHKVLIDEVLEDIDLTEKTTLFELQKAFE